MGTNYEHLTAEDRATLMVMRADGCSQRAVARCLGRGPSTISRELARNASCCKPVGDTIAVIPYDASLAGKRALVLRQEPRRSPKLAADTALFAVMLDYLRDGWSPEQREKYKWRHLVENFFCSIKAFRRIATRYEKTDKCFAALINLVGM